MGIANIRTKKNTNVMRRPLRTNALDVLENFNVSRNHLEEISQSQTLDEERLYRILTKGVDSSARSRKLAKYGMTFNVNT